MKKFIALLTLFFLLCVPTAHAQWATAGFNTASSNPNVGAAVGTLPVANGGTSRVTLTAGGLVYGLGTSAVGMFADVATGSILTSGGVGVVPTWTANASTAFALKGANTDITSVALTGVSSVTVDGGVTPLFKITNTASASEDYFAIYNSALTRIFRVDANGYVRGNIGASFSGNITNDGGYYIGTLGSNSNLIRLVHNTAGGTADYLSCTNSSSVVEISLKEGGGIALTGASTIAPSTNVVGLSIRGETTGASDILRLFYGPDGTTNCFKVDANGAVTEAGSLTIANGNGIAACGVINNTGNVNTTSGDFVALTVAKGPHIKSGANGLCGSSALVNGVKVVTTTAIGANDVVILTRTGGTITTAGQLWEVKASRSNATSFTVNSVYPLAGGLSAASATDDATFDWVIQKVD